MNIHQEFAVQALNALRGDNFPRARRAFAGHTPEQMAAQYGMSGQTCAEILAGYEAHDARVNAAIEWVVSRP